MADLRDRIPPALHKDPTTLPRLHRQERDVLTLLAAGHTYNAIGNKLSISNRTVRRILQRAAEKLGATTPINAVSIASYYRMLGTHYLPENSRTRTRKRSR